MIKQFKSKLKREGRSLSWWRKKYAPSVSYNYFIQQINDHAAIQSWLVVKIERWINK